jgi:hypothetical protein
VQTYTNVQVVNLLSKNPSSPEFQLSDSYSSMIATLKRENGIFRAINYHEFDFSAIIQRDKYERLDELANSIRERLADFSFNVYESSVEVIVQRQYGVIRTNCLDCLDRTNVVQTYVFMINYLLFSKAYLQNFICKIGLISLESISMDTTRKLWTTHLIIYGQIMEIG